MIHTFQHYSSALLQTMDVADAFVADVFVFVADAFNAVHADDDVHADVVMLMLMLWMMFWL